MKEILFDIVFVSIHAVSDIHYHYLSEKQHPKNIMLRNISLSLIVVFYHRPFPFSLSSTVFPWDIESDKVYEKKKSNKDVHGSHHTINK